MATSIETKALKRLIVKQIKKNYPNFNSHPKERKRKLLKIFGNKYIIIMILVLSLSFQNNNY